MLRRANTHSCKESSVSNVYTHERLCCFDTSMCACVCVFSLHFHSLAMHSQPLVPTTNCLLFDREAGDFQALQCVWECACVRVTLYTCLYCMYILHIHAYMCGYRCITAQRRTSTLNWRRLTLALHLPQPSQWKVSCRVQVSNSWPYSPLP